MPFAIISNSSIVDPPHWIIANGGIHRGATMRIIGQRCTPTKIVIEDSK